MLYLVAIYPLKPYMLGCLLKNIVLSSPNNNINSIIEKFSITNYTCTCKLVITLPNAVVACPV